MKVRFNKDHIDFKEGKDYDVIDTTAVYLIRLGVAKEVTTKAKEQKIAIETKELKTSKESK